MGPRPTLGVSELDSVARRAVGFSGVQSGESAAFLQSAREPELVCIQAAAYGPQVPRLGVRHRLPVRTL